jgi:hypothetical protein
MIRNLSPYGFSSFWLIGLNCLKQNIKRIELRDKLINGILELVDEDRNNNK